MEFANDLKNLDQHFLIDDKVITTFIDTANILKTDEVVEIGPGNGILTNLIAPKAKNLTCIELDRRLAPQLEKIAERHKNIELVFGNVLDCYIPKCDKIITSLPYRIIEPLISKLLKCEFNELFLIVGNKYAEGVLTKQHNRLSILTNCFFQTTKYIEILPSSFNPPPRVKSVLIKLEPVNYEDLNNTYLLFRLMFNLRGKKVKSNLLESLIKFYSFKGLILTKNEGKQIINNFNLSEELLNKTFETCSNDELNELSLKFEQIEGSLKYLNMKD